MTVTSGTGEKVGKREGTSGPDIEALTDWVSRNVAPGTILSLGSAPWQMPPRGDLEVVTVQQLAAHFPYKAIFDHVWIRDIRPGADAAKVIRQAYDAAKPGGKLILTTPFGLGRQVSASMALYLASVRRLVEPLFDIARLDLVDTHIALVATRRAEPNGSPTLELDTAELAFRDHEQRMNRRIDELAKQQIKSGALYRGAIARAERLQGDLDGARRDLANLRRRLARIRPAYIIPLKVVRKIRRIKQANAAATAILSTSPVATTSASLPVPALASQSEAVNVGWREGLRADFETWVQNARDAEGDEVAVMFSGTTFIQEHRANRPIRLTKVYLGRKCPVFFNYYRWTEKDALPTHPDPLLFQSPIDATPTFLDELLTTDFGGKKKVFYASFPHELMVRYVTVAAQHGWVTIYDARDDWEEFAKVGMAKWHHPGYERYIATHADVVSAVSRPLARKMSAIAGGRTVHVSANGLDPDFPRPSGPRVVGGSPIIGYFGHLTDKWFDWPLVIEAAQRYADFTFELAGHQAPNLTLPTNVKLLGMLGHQELADRSLTWAVAIIPFKNSPLADAVDPIKVYEYLHLGLPVLATYFPQCRDYPGTTITEGSADFLERLPTLVGTVLDQQKTTEWLADNTWARRVDRYSELADEVRQQGRTGVMALLEGAL